MDMWKQSTAARPAGIVGGRVTAAVGTQTAANGSTLNEPWLRYSVNNLVIQPTTLCNLDCTYCYLPFRDKNRRLPKVLAEKIANDLIELDTPVTVIWHGGEPLATGLEYFKTLVEPFEELRSSRRVEHVIQTNATLITGGWCDLLKHYDFGVGISLDGPKHFNKNRLNLSGSESFDGVMAGVQLLKTHCIDFSVIAVVNALNIDAADELFSFFGELGCSSLGINIEEREGTNQKNYQGRERVEKFWNRLFELWVAQPTFKIREFSRAISWMEAATKGEASFPKELRYDIFPTISVDGSVVMLAPELNGPYSTVRYPSFTVGNISDQSLKEIIARAQDVHYVKDYLKGVSNCRDSCEYFNFCLGGSASNKFFECGDLTHTTTTYCENGQKAVVDAVLKCLEKI